MVVDDEPDICLLLKLVLENNGYIVYCYDNSVAALDEYKSNFYDLIILDMSMPYMNGMELYREIRKKDINSRICFLTATEMIHDIKKEFSSVYNFIKKPIENEELILTINDLINK